MGGNGASSQGHQYSPSSFDVALALETARDSAEGAQDPVVSQILETAIQQLWARIRARPTTYVMTRDEFALFNYFQQRFIGEAIAVAARRRYWDQWPNGSNNTSNTSGS